MWSIYETYRILKYVRCRRITLLDPLIKTKLSPPPQLHVTDANGSEGGQALMSRPLPCRLIIFATSQSYDLVVVVNVLEHCFSASKFFDQILSLTAPHGTFRIHDKLIPAAMIHTFVENIIRCWPSTAYSCRSDSEISE